VDIFNVMKLKLYIVMNCAVLLLLKAVEQGG